MNGQRAGIMRIVERMAWVCIVSVGCLLQVTGAAAATDLASIPTPRPAGWVVDQAGLLSTADVAAINALGNSVHTRNGAEMAVVVIQTTGGADPRSFATSLFNRWQIGDRTRNNGLLVFVAVRDRAAEIILGDGIDSDAQVAVSDRIMRDEIVARFKRGDGAGAVVAGARACAAEFFGVRPAAPVRPPEAATTDLERPTTASPPRAVTSSPSAGRPVVRKRTDPAVFLIPVGLGVVVVPIVLIAAQSANRSRPRKCEKCGGPMTRLCEAEDDAFLEKGEQLEEKVGSVDYDVWMCAPCGTVQKVRYGRWFSGYAKCPRCGVVTKNSVQTTLAVATTLSTGLIEVHEHCANCGYDHRFTHVIPRKTKSHGHGSSGFGGGHSSGGGSSGRW